MVRSMDSISSGFKLIVEIGRKLKVGVIRLPPIQSYSVCIGGYLYGPPKVPLESPPPKSLPEASIGPPKFDRLDSIPGESTGTMVLAFIFEGGVIVAAEHQRSLFKWSIPNVVGLNSHVVATISGGSEFLLKDLQKKCRLHEPVTGRRTSVAEASEWLGDTLASHVERGLSVGVLIAGWEETGPILYHVDSEEKVQNCEEIRDCTGKVHKGRIMATGDGAQCCLGLGVPDDMCVDKAAFYGKQMICAASWALVNGTQSEATPEYCDVVSVYHIGSTGWKKHMSAHDIEDHQKMHIRTHPDYIWKE
ncbi:OLC1v1028701C1 [Oldenlandia corymbosa var. corymbosa]|nr:OLC1v1028701C1 [Oldenlandia corymbosa var. corymbosa]